VKERIKGQSKGDNKGREKKWGRIRGLPGKRGTKGEGTKDDNTRQGAITPRHKHASRGKKGKSEIVDPHGLTTTNRLGCATDKGGREKRYVRGDGDNTERRRKRINQTVSAISQPRKGGGRVSQGRNKKTGQGGGTGRKKLGGN